MKVTDRITSKKMAAVPQKGTSVEILVRNVLEEMKMPFETNLESLPGRPDIWLVDEEIPIFVHGCFWHRHEGCSKSSSPKSNENFWEDKFQKNISRDQRTDTELRQMGYTPIVVWQCETKDSKNLKNLLYKRLAVCRSRIRSQDGFQ